MKKYWLVIKNMWDDILTYRLNFTVWRIRNVFQLLTIYFLWFALLPKNGQFGGYSQNLMLTYILGTSLLGSIVFSTQTGTIGDQINNGDLSNFLLRPINMFKYWFARDIGDKVMNISFSIVELSIIFLILRPPFFLQTNPLYIISAFIAIALSIFVYFYFSILLGFIGFWSSETWAPRFIFMTLLSFFAGGLFPLDILPRPLFAIATALPFTYMIYFPIKIYLGQISFISIIEGLSIAFLWVGIMYVVTKFIWLKGLQSYTAQGK